MNQLERIFSGSPWEKKVGYCRAVKFGQSVAVSGTTSIDKEGSVFAPGDANQQTTRCLEIIENALKRLGADRSHIVRTRMFVTDISTWAEIGRAHEAFFSDSPPATTMVQITKLIHPDMVIEIEADAHLGPM